MALRCGRHPRPVPVARDEVARQACPALVAIFDDARPASGAAPVVRMREREPRGGILGQADERACLRVWSVELEVPHAVMIDRRG